ncbi:hypothetical protein VTK73DRAFT_2893 [Phialemonium thermophilum]|uniref:2-methylcitrate dehydratase PrpD n=1 Tax=Phialemonium thermophilum TaxID=223376 RepID=A0ABR3X254_9PEZI
MEIAKVKETGPATPKRAMSSEPLTKSFAEAVDAAARSYTDEDREAALLHFVDGIGTAYAGYRRPEMHKLLHSSVVDVGRDYPSWLIGHALKSRPSDAALLNAMAAHLDDFDDDETMISIAHVTVPTLAATLAAASMVADPSGRLILDSFLSGVHTMVALGELLNPAHYHLGWHASATLGVFGAAMASAHVLGLSAAEKATALSFAVTASSGTRSAFGSSAKPWQVAAASRDGLNAALLAAAGLDAHASLFGSMGLAELYGGDTARREAVFARISGASPFIDPGVTLKAYPCCTAAHTAMEACEAIRRHMAGRWTPRDIASVEVRVGRTIPAILALNEPSSALEGKFSMPFCAAVALCLPSVGLQAFQDEVLRDPAVQHVMGCVEMIGVAEQDDPFLCKVKVALGDGSSFAETVERTRGSPQRPLTRADLKAKVVSLCHGADAEGAIRHLFALPTAKSWRAFEQQLSIHLKL